MVGFRRGRDGSGGAFLVAAGLNRVGSVTLTLGRHAYFADLPFADSFAVSLQHMCKHAFILLIETAPMLHPCVTHTHTRCH